MSHMSASSVRASSRERQLTADGHELYKQQVEKYLIKLGQVKRDIDFYFLGSLPTDLQQLQQIRQDVIDRYATYEQHSSSFISFLQGTRTTASKQEETEHILMAQSLRDQVDSFINNIDGQFLPTMFEREEKPTSVETCPQRSTSSAKQNSTSASVIEKRNSMSASMTEKQDTHDSTSASVIEKQNSISVSISKKQHSAKTIRTSKKSDYRSAKTRNSCKSKDSIASHASEMLVKEQLKLEAAKVKLKYTEKEQDIIRQKAALDADLERLGRQREVDEAESKVKTLQEAIQASNDLTDESDVSEDEVFNRTEQFVMRDSYERLGRDNKTFDQNNNTNLVKTVAEIHQPIDNIALTKKTGRIPVNTVTDQHISNPDKVTFPNKRNNNVESANYQGLKQESRVGDSYSLNAGAPEFVPYERSKPHYDSMTMCDEFSKFMMRKELVFSRLTKYDDQPDMFVAWKSMFQNVVDDLHLSPSDEVDLLVKWLGPSSSKQALRIRSANAENPIKCRQRIWERLEDRFGRPEMVEDTIKNKIASFPKITTKDYRPLFDLADIVDEISAIMDNERYQSVFAHFNSSLGVNQIVAKLPPNLQEKWTQEANNYKIHNKVMYPPFNLFVSFIAKMAKLRNDPSFKYELPNDSNTQPRFRKNAPVHVSARVTGSREINTSDTVDSSNRSATHNPDSSGQNDDTLKNLSSCLIHPGSSHSLNMCRLFRTKPLSERKDILKKNGICYRCCGPKKHLSKSCTETVKCIVCKSTRHPSALHVESSNAETKASHEGQKPHEGERNVNNKCTQVCGSQNGTSKSCAKIIPVNVYPKNNPTHVRQVYCLIDDQSTNSLATTRFFNEFQEHGPEFEYVLSTCSGQFTTSGRRAKDYVLESLNGETSMQLNKIIECDAIPNNRSEIPSRDIAKKFDHLKDIATFIEPIMSNVEIELLIGRDLISAHHCLEHRMGENGLPYAQRLPLGWVILGETCLGKVHHPDIVQVNKTYILQDGRASMFKPCEYDLDVKIDHSNDIFKKTPYDENVGLSVEDKDFLEIMDSNFVKDQDNQWSVPLPFHRDRQPLPSNRLLALKRAKSFDSSLARDETKAKHVTDFMKKMLDNHHAEKAPPLKSGQEHWYLPVFGVYHPRKPENIRLVFDSSAKFENRSLNDEMLKGPDLTNKLLGILLNFRKEKIAITCDVEQMFYNFRVREDHRDYLRFLWHEQNDLSKPLTDFRMTVHVFGNRPSPSIATYGFRKTVENEDQDVRNFVNKHFYVDDGLISCENVNEAVSLIKRTKGALLDGGNIRLHKIASNSTELLERFDSNDLAKGLKDLDLSSDELPTQRSLGVSWDIATDEITFQISSDVKPFTKRGVLSTINSIYDPVGFAAPVVIRGKLLLREMIGSSTVDWDDILPDLYRSQWESWVTSLTGLETLRIPRMYTSISFASATLREIHIFSDASKEAIGAVAYIKLSDGDSTEISFVMGKAKVAPLTGHTIPRLELCGAVLAVEMADTIKEHLKIETENIHFYTDSQVVLGYINNKSRRFYVYVCNRISRIHASSAPTQWHYVSSETNPADLATRCVHATNLNKTSWFRGPEFLLDNSPPTTDYDLVNPDGDQEVRPEIQTLKTAAVECKSLQSVSSRFDRFSEWRKLVSAFSVLRKRIHCQKSEKSLKCNDVQQLLETERFVIKSSQREEFPDEICALMKGEKLPRNSSILSLDPFLDANGILRVGGRLKHSELSDSTKQPVIVPKNHHVAILIVRHYHSKVAHQGRLFTESAIRNAGYWIVGVKRLISSVLRQCVKCKRLRGKTCTQQMADLPRDRVTPSPPFSFVGVDAFGPWPVTFRRTRGGVAQAKRWALLFTCLATRAIHLEVIEELSSSSFINAWRRFIAIRGPVRHVRSDRGTNFVGATQDLSMVAQFVEDPTVQSFLSDNRIIWEFNPPHASHFGGSWERLIGVSRRILDSLLLENRFKDLTHEMLTTFLAEVTAIVNNRPLTSISYDSDSPSLITPALLLTQKDNNNQDVPPFPDFEKKDAIRHHWKYVQFLAQKFWTKWQNEYLHSLQERPKWKTEEPNVKIGTVVLMKDNDCVRNNWPIGTVERVFPSDDGKVRKVELRVLQDGKPKIYVRPISQIVSLVEPE